MQRKLREQEELALHEQRISESLKVLHQEDMEDFARYHCVLSIILPYGEKLMYTLLMLFYINVMLVLLEHQCKP